MPLAWLTRAVFGCLPLILGDGIRRQWQASLGDHLCPRDDDALSRGSRVAHLDSDQPGTLRAWLSGVPHTYSG